MRRYELNERAESELKLSVARVESKSGLQRAEGVRFEFMREFRR